MANRASRENRVSKVKKLTRVRRETRAKTAKQVTAEMKAGKATRLTMASVIRMIRKQVPAQKNNSMAGPGVISSSVNRTAGNRVSRVVANRPNRIRARVMASVQTANPLRLTVIGIVMNKAQGNTINDNSRAAFLSAGRQQVDLVRHVLNKWIFRKPQGGQKPWRNSISLVQQKK